jgi:hypothetical protein
MQMVVQIAWLVGTRGTEFHSCITQGQTVHHSGLLGDGCNGHSGTYGFKAGTRVLTYDLDTCYMPCTGSRAAT